jgi:DNA recombination protein RmuC
LEFAVPDGFAVESALLVIALIFAALFAVAIVFLWLSARTGRAESRRAATELAEARQAAEAARERVNAAETDAARATARAEHLAPLEGRLEEAQARIRTLEAEIAARDSRAEAERQNFEQRAADLTRLRGELERDFKGLANSALGESRESFLTLADEVFKKHRAEATADIETRKKAVEELIRPIGETLKVTREKLDQIEKERADTFGQIRQQLQSVGHEAARLTQALRANPGTRGRWGEESLKNALELAGLSAHCDFETQATFAQLDSSIRPDCVIRLPGGRSIVVDAKAPISAYLDAMEAMDEAARAQFLKRHADALRQHMVSLSRKEYAQTVARELAAPPDFVAMYVPGENFYAAAIERNGDLFSEAISRGVFIVTPTTLIALAKAIALGWRQEDIAENYREVAALGRELYQRLCVMGDHLAKVGRSLEGAVKHYNSFVGSLETSVLPQGRRFRELGIDGGGKALDLIELIETEVREPVRERDLAFGTAEQRRLPAAE